jgi:RNA polymerase sigma-70 factor (ECF subfamily)
MSTWLGRVLQKESGFEAELVARYSDRLLAFARRELTAFVRRRVDPEDVVQSVYRSFFNRLHQGQFAFEESHDLWRPLAAMTFHKTRNVVKFHLRERRDSRREQPLGQDDNLKDSSPDEHDLAALVNSLEKLVSKLSDTRREIVLRRLDGMPIQDIAAQVGCSRQTVYRVLPHVQEIAAQELEPIR